MNDHVCIGLLGPLRHSATLWALIPRGLSSPALGAAHSQLEVSAGLVPSEGDTGGDARPLRSRLVVGGQSAVPLGWQTVPPIFTPPPSVCVPLVQRPLLGSLLRCDLISVSYSCSDPVSKPDPVLSREG